MNRAQTMFHVGFELMAAGLQWTGKDYERLVQRAVEDHVSVVSDAVTVFFGTLYAKGARIPSPTSELRRFAETWPSRLRKKAG
ncbi:MAG: hypothetical protein ACRENE_27575 [Polyangiaceae bacterium]